MIIVIDPCGHAWWRLHYTTGILCTKIYNEKSAVLHLQSFWETAAQGLIQGMGSKVGTFCGMELYLLYKVSHPCMCTICHCVLSYSCYYIYLCSSYVTDKVNNSIVISNTWNTCTHSSVLFKCSTCKIPALPWLNNSRFRKR